ncbi:pectin acetylesterase 11-like [Paramuricea clavata]|uniref:Pectin acetylesterase 11-like n=1 Tax=Paramuricea clavata TaxID=317549 RepID=A0A7D9E5C0_PARCT|nr:pectin acetylesterase 11-like [Paramuricea clavata]
MNLSVTQTKHCELCRARLGRDAEKIQVQKEVKKRETSKMEMVFLKTAVSTGAVCLDGSPPGYHFRKGFGIGTNKWIIFFNGGAWCFDEQSCYERSHTVYGSSRFYTVFSENGLYSNDPQINPDFHNWNMVFIIYCDGSSFTGMRQNPVYFMAESVHFRGKAILEAIIQDLLSKGVRSASDVLLSGSSAGSLAVLIHADFIRSKLNPKTKVRAIADSGYFLDIETQYGTNKTRDMFNRMLLTHNSTSSLHEACIKRMAKADHWKCFFPQYFFDLIETPVFVLQSSYDVWQIVNGLDIVCVIPSYEDILLFRSLKRLRTVRKTVENPVVTSSRNTPRGTGNVSHEAVKASRGKNHESRATGHASLKRLHTVRKTLENPVVTSSRNTPRGTGNVSHETAKASRGKIHESRATGHASRGTNHASRETSHPSRGTNHAQELDSIPVKNAHWQTRIPTSTRSKFLAEYIPRIPRVNSLVPRVQRANNRGQVPTLVLNNRQTPVWRSPRWRYNLATQDSWNNPAISRSASAMNEVARPNNLVQTFNSPGKSKVLRRQNLDNTQTFPFYNIRQTVPALHLSSVNRVRAYSPTNGGQEPRAYSAINANVAHFRQKRKPGSTQFVLQKSRSISTKDAQFRRKRKPRKTQNVRPKSRTNMQKKEWHWLPLYSSPTPCTKDETEKILNMRKMTIEALKPVITKPHSGLFLSSCFEHTQATYNNIWQKSRVNGKSPRDAIAEWYFGKPGNHIHIGPEFEFESCVM